MAASARTGLKFTHKLFLAAALFLFCLGLAQALYYASVFANLPTVIPPADMILIYSGPDDRTEILRDWGDKPSPLFLLSGQDYTAWKLQRELKSGRPMLVEDWARTTDQNARYCAPIVLKKGVKQVVLALPWYHLPRAMFLTRVYLRGTGVTVAPYATVAVPSGWYLRPIFWIEMVKFWGSLMRVGLSHFGVQDFPPPTGGFWG